LQDEVEVTTLLLAGSRVGDADATDAQLYPASPARRKTRFVVMLHAGITLADAWLLCPAAAAAAAAAAHLVLVEGVLSQPPCQQQHHLRDQRLVLHMQHSMYMQQQQQQRGQETHKEKMSMLQMAYLVCCGRYTARRCCTTL
jgi:hypothetical protein